MSKERFRRVRLASKEQSRPTKFEFLAIRPEELLCFMLETRTGSSRDLLVWMLLLNTRRVTKQQTFKFSPRWRTGLPLDRKTVYRCLKRLHKAGLIHVEFQRGKSPVVTITLRPEKENVATPLQDEPECERARTPESTGAATSELLS